jgi:hypothetical protein
LFLVIRQLDRGRAYSQPEYLVNAIELLKEAALGTMTEQRRQEALALLERADQSDPLVAELKRIVAGTVTVPTPPASVGERAARRARGWVARLVRQSWFSTAVVVFFAIWTAASLAQVVALVFFGGVDGGSAEVLRLGRDITSVPLSDGQQTFIKAATVTASLVASGFSLIGLRRIAEDRRAAAFSMFERALLISIFFTQVFAFMHSQFAAVFGLLLNLLLFLVVRTILAHELGQATMDRADAIPDRAVVTGSG